MRLPSVASRSCRDENRRGSNKRNSRARVISSRSNKVRFNTPGNIVVAEGKQRSRSLAAVSVRCAGWDRQEADALAEDPALVPQLLEWDVVEYSKPAAGDAAVHRLGRVVHISESSCLVEPMVQKVELISQPLDQRWHSDASRSSYTYDSLDSETYASCSHQGCGCWMLRLRSQKQCRMGTLSG